MDALLSVLSSAGVTVLGLWLFSEKIFDNRLARSLEKAKLEWAGEQRKQIEMYLGEKKAERDYEYEAKKRLYTAIGPLKFQLLLACRDLTHRIREHGDYGYNYSLSASNYYGYSTLYRIIRPLAISELIERQIAYADFAVDSDAIMLLRFKRSAYSALCGGDMICNNPNANWDMQVEHIYYHSITTLATAIIMDDNGERRPMYADEFKAFVQTEVGLKTLSPLPEIMSDFTPITKPIFWNRLVCYADICARLVNAQGGRADFETITLNINSLLDLSADDYILEKKAEISVLVNAAMERGL